MNEFIKMVVEDIKANISEDAKVECHEVIKNNDVKLHGITITFPGEKIVPTLYVENYLNEYEYPIDIAYAIIDDYDKAVETQKQIQFSPEDMMDLNKVIDKLCVRLINIESNKEMLSNMPWMKWNDLAKILVIEINENMSVKVNNNIIQEWKKRNPSLNVSILFNGAIGNTRMMYPAEIKSMNEIMAEFMGMDTSEFVGKYNDSFQYVLTNNKKINGATCLLYPNVLKEFANEINSDFVILPSSIHEVILQPMDKEMTLEELTKIVQDVNKKEVSDTDVLSNHAYIYIKETGMIEY